MTTLSVPYLIGSGQYDRARHYLQAALEMAEDSHDAVALPNILLTLGEVEARRGDFRSSRGYLLRGRREAGNNPDRKSEIECLYWLADVESIVGNVKHAQTHLDEAANLAADSGDERTLSDILISQAHLTLIQGEFDQVEQLLTRAASLAEKSQNRNAYTLGGLAKTYTAQNRILEARALATSARETCSELQHYKTKEIDDWLSGQSALGGHLTTSTQ